MRRPSPPGPWPKRARGGADAPSPSPAPCHDLPPVLLRHATGHRTMGAAMAAAVRNPVRIVPLAFLGVMLLGTALLLLPAAHAGESRSSVLSALFTAVSATSLSGLAMVDPAAHWSRFGQGVILLLMQLGGLGIMTGATLLGLLVTRRLRLSSRLVAHAETRSLALGDVAAILRLVLALTLGAELLVAGILALRLHGHYGLPWGEALWQGLFHAVSAYTNAGLSTWPDSLVRFAADPVVTAPVMAAVVLGGIGVPVIHDLRRHLLRPDRWSVYTRLTLLGTLGLLLAGWALVLAYEWGNPGTLGALPPVARPGGALFHAVMTRSGGFNTVDTGAMRPETLMASAALMLIGGGSAGTAGGIKVTTFMLLGLAVWAEIRGEPDTNAFGRRIPQDTLRQALTVALLAIGVVCVATLLLMSMTDFGFDAVLFEVVSAFATVGLSTGITGALPPAGQVVLVVLMFLGRVGTVTVVTALALRSHRTPYRYPEERPIVG
ncbi:TrkH family potassium uptake protein [Roseomonas sp. OT10]|uniref:TrkH family potassium uptake protein n=1 Tax=Roseomonas cutis TaxID=2897332 RepID=UPI001E3DDABC|nr:potassium transporter TrkG [Roseomonas sp. OT10]UFN51237.1 TrkH family potassium uptake protein [Roseomonas sp. OT10]